MTKALMLCVTTALFLLSGCSMPTLFHSEESLSPQVVDERIVAEISTRYLKNDKVTYLNIQPYSYDRHVYLVGEAASPEELDQAVTLAKSVRDVRSVTTFVLPKPKQPICSFLDNARIQRQVLTRLETDQQTSSSTIDLTVFQYVVVLTGEVDSWETEAELLARAQAVEGVRMAKSLLRVVR